MGSEKNQQPNARLTDKKAAVQKQSRMAKFSNEMSKILVASVKEVTKTNNVAADEDGPSDVTAAEKNMRKLISKAGQSHGIFMIRGDIVEKFSASGEGGSSVNQYGTACIDYGMLVNKAQAHGINSVALDNCAKITASNQRRDFIELDTSDEARNSARIIGVGGEAVCGGRGILSVLLLDERFAKP